MKRFVFGILAHVDAGKTTLSEAILYEAGVISSLGRVDHQDALLDYDHMERQRGITIYSKPARFCYEDCQLTLLDTPGHADFSSEMRRALSVLDAAVLVVSAVSGVQSHTLTIMAMLKKMKIPTFIFVNKMDIGHYTKEAMMNHLREKLHDGCVDFSCQDETFYEDCSLSDEKALDMYLEKGTIEKDYIAELIMKRKVLPCYFGSALKNQGVQELLSALCAYVQTDYDEHQPFSALIYKISHDPARVTHMKILSGTLKPKQIIDENEKADRVRRCNGADYQECEAAYAGEIVAVTGLKDIPVDTIVPQRQKSVLPPLSCGMEYAVKLPPDKDAFQVYPDFLKLKEENPDLSVRFDEQKQEIRLSLMGEVQAEILIAAVRERFGFDIRFDEGRVRYLETITKTALGIGHFEPLRHYAEVHLLLEPLPAGSGLQFHTALSTDELPLHWQRLVLTHLKETTFPGVLTGADITDISITLTAGAYHLKHTEGGDFREATYRAVRQGLKMADSIILEPYFNYEATVPKTGVSALIYELDLIGGDYEISTASEDLTLVAGKAPVKDFMPLYKKFPGMFHGQGQISYSPGGYYPARHQEDIISASGYDSELDEKWPTGSIFISHGAGYYVPYQDVYAHAHLPSAYLPKPEKKPVKKEIQDESLMAIFERTYGTGKKPPKEKTVVQTYQAEPQKPPCLLVDGYNIIFSWPPLAKLARENLDAARHRFIDILCNYQGYKNILMILVFDAYKVKDNPGSIEKSGPVYIVYTKEAQTADMFIERATHRYASEFAISVATSDALEQLVILAKGGRRIAARELITDIEYTLETKLHDFYARQKHDPDYLLEDLGKEEKK